MQAEELYDFTTCKYDLHRIRKEESCFDRYADLGAFRNFFTQKKLRKGLDIEFIMKFLILSYTPSSPIVKEHISDLKTRKTKVLNYLGIDSQIQITKEIQDAVTLKDVAVASMWIMFLRIQANESWTFLVNAQERYSTLLEESVKVSRKKDKKTGEDTDDIDGLEETRKNKMIADLRDQIKNGMEVFMLGERSKVLEEFVSFSLVSESLNIMPEEYVSIWAKTNKLPYDLNETGL